MWPSVLTLAMTSTLKFQGQMWNSLYLSQKWSDCHETKSKHIDRSQDLKYDHWVWSWTWLWPWVFKVKFGIGYISAKNGPIATKRKANTSIELLASNATIRFDLGCDLYLEFSRWNMNFYISQPKLARLPRNEKQTYWFKLYASNMTNGLDLGHDLDIWILKVICDLDHLVTKVRCKDLPDSDWGDLRCRHAVDSSSWLSDRSCLAATLVTSPNTDHQLIT